MQVKNTWYSCVIAVGDVFASIRAGFKTDFQNHLKHEVEGDFLTAPKNN